MMQKFALRVATLLVIVVPACTDSAGPGDGADLSRYVAMGTSLSMGVMSDGVYQATQLTSWPKLLANDVGAGFDLPRILPPGCPALLAPQLVFMRRLDGTSALTRTACGQNFPDVTLPTQNVAIDRATANDAVNTTGLGGLPSRVLLASQTQVTAMRAQNPTFVSVEFGFSEILPSLSGLVTTAPLATFAGAYETIVSNVKATGAKAVLVTLPSDISKLLLFRGGPEIAVERRLLGAANVSVNSNCDNSPNLVSIRKFVSVFALASERFGAGPVEVNCADVPGTEDGILTPGEVGAINAMMSQMNAFITTKASENGYALFSLGELYDTAKSGVNFDWIDITSGSGPFGPRISLDAIHPNVFGQEVLMQAAKAAIMAKYGSITH